MAKPLLLIIENPTRELTVEQAHRLELERSGWRLVFLRQTGRPDLPPKTAYFDNFEDAKALERDWFTEDGIEILLVGFRPDETLPLYWIRSIGSRSVRLVHRLDELSPVDGDGEEEPLQTIPHRPLAAHRSRALSVFPGPMVPTYMGSHQRAFGVLIALNAAGIWTDALVTGGSQESKDRAVEVLSQICPRVFTYRDRRRKLPPLMLARKGIEIGVRRLAGRPRKVPDLFEERLAVKGTFSGRKRLRRLLEAGRYDTVIINYAWMEQIRERVPGVQNGGRVEWICDSHDVQFVRGPTNNAGELRVGRSEAREKRVELEILNRFDRVLAISDADAQVLRDHLPEGRVIRAPNGFDYARLDPPELDLNAPRFGFIGGKMDANVKAVELLMNEWWPAIAQRWPDARLSLAGTVSEQSAVTSLCFLKENVELLGIVESLPSFYASLDVLLNPVVVRGGLNFKSIEALMGARVLVTTEMGLDCLGDRSLAIAAETPSALISALEDELGAPAAFANRRREITARAAQRFGDGAAYRELIAHLRGTANAARNRTSRRSQVVLIQVGDHFENWRRVLPLAEATHEMGHHPVMLVYKPEGIPFFLSHGVDAVALYDHDETKAERVFREVRVAGRNRLGKRYRGYDLDDLSSMAGATATRKWKNPETRKFIRDITRHIDRVERLTDRVQPDTVFVWNGYTGHVANILRQYAKNRRLPTLFMERFVVPNALFVDPDGVNGYSSISKQTRAELLAGNAAGDDAPLSKDDVCPEVTRDQIEALRRAGPWRAAKRIVFIPLQVAKDTNILLHSPELRTMGELISKVVDELGGEDTVIVARPHPEEVDALDLPSMPGLFVDSTGELQVWLALADHVATINSTVGLEALLRGTVVSSYGNSVYSGKGLTDGEVVPSEAAEAYFAALVNRHACLDGHAPAVLREVLPTLDKPHRRAPFNPFDLHPEDSERAWSKKRKEIRERAIEVGGLTVVAEIAPNRRFSETYRRTQAPITREWLTMRARAEFSLPPDVEIDVVRSIRDTNGPSRSKADDKRPLVVLNEGRAKRVDGLALDVYFAPRVAHRR